MNLLPRGIYSILLVLCLLLAAPFFGPTVSAMTKCEHVGDTQTISKVSQVCKKANGKLIWSTVTRKSKSTREVPHQIVVAKSWVEYTACLDSYNSSPFGSMFASTNCQKLEPEPTHPVKSYSEYIACQKYADENPSFGMFLDCSPWHP